MKQLVLYMLATVLLSIGAASTTHAATITVDTTNMTSQAAGNGNPAECSLLDAIAAANTNTAVNACAAGDPAATAADVIDVPAGVYTDTYWSATLTESATLAGAGVGATVIDGLYLTLSPNSPSSATLLVRDMSFLDSYVNIYNSDSSVANTVTVQEVALDATNIGIYPESDYPLTTTLRNINGVNGSSINYGNDGSSDPGTTSISNVTLDGAGSSDVGITHYNPLNNSTMSIENSVITNFETGILNVECTPDIFSYGSLATLYITNSSIGGGNMQTGVQNTCGHLVVNSSTFQDISGNAISASTNFAPVERIYSNGVLVSTTCPANLQFSSDIELTNNTFTDITVAPMGTAPAGIVSLDSTLNGICPSQSLTTDTKLLMKHNTFAGNTLGAYADVAVTDDTVLESLDMQNNAFEGSSVLGAFTVSGAKMATNNFSTENFAGPSFLSPSFKRVSSFLLAPLNDPNGRDEIGYGSNGGYPAMLRPMWGSPLLDAGDDVGVAVDQRGGTRSLLKAYDIGAVEVTRVEVLGDGVSAAELDLYLNGASTGTGGDGTADDMLADTGVSMEFYISAALGMIVVGGAALIRRRDYRQTM